MIDTARCHKCKRQFPDHLIDNLITVTGGKMTSLSVCPICALDLSNKQHGINRAEFTGEKANQMLKNAREYLEKKKRWNNS
jgi:hypothetical protein